MTEMKKPCVMYCHHEHIQVSINIKHVNILVCAIISTWTYGLHMFVPVPYNNTICV